jgi:hypothetical protein
MYYVIEANSLAFTIQKEQAGIKEEITAFSQSKKFDQNHILTNKQTIMKTLDTIFDLLMTPETDVLQQRGKFINIHDSKGTSWNKRRNYGL